MSASEPPKTDWAEAAEQQLLDHALTIAPREGWTWRTAKLAGKAMGLSEGDLGVYRGLNYRP